eukprot:2665112-Prymnesium_polylepis.2
MEFESPGDRLATRNRSAPRPAARRIATGRARRARGTPAAPPRGRPPALWPACPPHRQKLAVAVERAGRAAAATGRRASRKLAQPLARALDCRSACDRSCARRPRTVELHRRPMIR